MKIKYRSFFILICVTCYLLAACAGVQDWEYNLPNDMLLTRTSGRNLCIVSADRSSTVVPSLITCFWINGDMVGTCVILPDDYNSYLNGADDISQTYYTLDTINATVLGPYDNERQYEQKLEEIGIPASVAWIPTYPRPDGAIYGPLG